MIYYENAFRGPEGFNSQLVRYTMCLALSNFLERPFYLASGEPSNTPPEYASSPEYADRYRIIMESERSRVEDLLTIPRRMVTEMVEESPNSFEVEILSSRFLTTAELKDRFAGTFLWDAFAVGRIPLVKEELLKYDLLKFTHGTLNSPAYAFFLPRREKEDLLRSVNIAYLEEIERLAHDIADELGAFDAVHIRFGDFRKLYAPVGFKIETEKCRSFFNTIFPHRDRPIVLATDAMHEKEELAALFEGQKIIFLDEHIFDSYIDRFRELPFTDFNVLTILDQLVCTKAETFVGTYRSTFTSIIHRIRQERYGKNDFHFLPDEHVARLIGSDGVIRRDRDGFFDWNRYSIFNATHEDMAWRREWDHKLTSLDLEL